MNLDNLPEKDYFTFDEISKRWNEDKAYIEQLIDAGKIPCVSTCSHTVLVWDNIHFRVNHAGYINAKTTIRFK